MASSGGLWSTDEELDIPEKALYIIDRPQLLNQDGKHCIQFQYVQYDPQEEPQVQEMTCEGYLADPYTFTTITTEVSDWGDETANIKDGEEITLLPKRNVTPHSHVRINDYVIMMSNSTMYWGSFTKDPDPNAQEQKPFQPGYVGCVTDPNFKQFYLIASGYEQEYQFWLDRCDAVYIFRTDIIMDLGCDLPPYVIDKPIEFEQDGKPYLKFQWFRLDEHFPQNAEPFDEVCEGYRVDKETFSWLNKVYDETGKHLVK